MRRRRLGIARYRPASLVLFRERLLDRVDVNPDEWWAAGLVEEAERKRLEYVSTTWAPIDAG